MNILANVTAIGFGLQTTFLGSGGTAPYTYSVVPDALLPAGGTISSSGLYTAGLVNGVDQIKVTDSLGAKATTQIKVGSPINLVVDIIQNQMALANNQVYLWDQKINIPNDFQLYIAVGILSCKPFGNTYEYDGSGSGLVGVQSTNFMATLSLDIFSRSSDALTRKEEVIMALKSAYAEQQMEANSFYVASQPTGFVNLSEIDGAAIPYRFNISVNLQYFLKKTQSIPYFSTFSKPTVLTNA